MTEMEYGLAEIADALNRLALAIAGLICILIVMSWSLDDMAQKIHLFGFMVRRLTRPVPADSPAADPSPTPAASAAKEPHSENHTVRP